MVIRGSVYEEERTSHRPSRPGSRTGSLTHFGDQDTSFGFRNMNSQWAMLQQQALLQQQQMMALNPLQFQVQFMLLLPVMTCVI